MSEEARNKTVHSALSASPKETGGILLGWVEGQNVVVSDVLVVDDPESGNYHYVRNYERAEAALSEYLTHIDNSLLGYVGEWHSHPMLQPPSAIDRRSLQAVVIEAERQAAMVVIAFDRGEAVSCFGIIGRIQAGKVDLIDVTPEPRLL